MDICNLPKSVILELTYRCNHNCKFCSSPWLAPNSKYPKRQELSVKEWKKAIDILLQNGVEGFTLSGGEVLMKEGFDEILSYIRDRSNRLGFTHPIMLISNGRAMKEEHLRLFKELNVHLSMSLPGYETFKEHTGVDNAEGVLHWFELAKRIGLRTTVNITVTQKNYHELFQTISMGLLSGADDVLLNRFLPGGRGLAHISELSITPAQVNGMLDTAEEALSYAHREGNVGIEIPWCSIKDPYKYKKIHVGYRCSAAKAFFVIDPAGQIRVCNHSPKTIGHVFGTPMIEDTDYWNLFATSHYTPSMCSGCNKNKYCDCGCREAAHILNESPCDKDTSIIV